VAYFSGSIYLLATNDLTAFDFNASVCNTIGGTINNGLGLLLVTLLNKNHKIRRIKD
jgi:hypothetical protein